MEFYEICDLVKEQFFQDWERRENSGAVLEIQKRAIVGYEKEKKFFLERISEILLASELKATGVPSWYANMTLTQAIFQEIWGFGPMAEWFVSDKFMLSPKLVVIGKNIYCLENGRLVLLSQTIATQRKEQFVKALFLLTPKERMDKNLIFECDLLDNTHCVIDQEQDTLIFTRAVATIGVDDFLLAITKVLTGNTVLPDINSSAIKSVEAKGNTLEVVLSNNKEMIIEVKEKGGES